MIDPVAAALAIQLTLAAYTKGCARDLNAVRARLGSAQLRLSRGPVMTFDVLAALLILYEPTRRWAAAGFLLVLGVASFATMISKGKDGRSCGCFGDGKASDRLWRVLTAKLAMGGEALLLLLLPTHELAGASRFGWWVAGVASILVVVAQPHLVWGRRGGEALTPGQVWRRISDHRDFAAFQSAMLSQEPIRVDVEGQSARLVFDGWWDGGTVLLVASVTPQGVTLQALDGSTLTPAW